MPIGESDPLECRRGVSPERVHLGNEELRDYAPWDDVRWLEWNATARMGRPIVKRMREERDVVVQIDPARRTGVEDIGSLPIATPFRGLNGAAPTVPLGQVGQMVVRTRAPWALNSGYHRDPAATAEALARRARAALAG